MVNKVLNPQPRASATDARDSRAKVQLGKEAIRCALNGEWELAAAANRQILDICPTNCEASNRLAKALMELGDYSGARRTLEELRLHAPANVIARKNLARLDQLQNRSGQVRAQPAVTGKSPGMFIAESGKSCTTLLCRQAVSPESASVSAGDVVLLSALNDGIAVNTLDGQNLGTLPRRLGRRLNKLMAGGNRYEAAVVGFESDRLSIILQETSQAPALRHVVSFPAQVSELNRPVAAAAPDDFLPPPDDDSDQAQVDGTDSDGALDPAESAVMEMPDDTTIGSVGIDEVPTLDTDDDPVGWSPVTTSPDDAEEWD